MKLTVFQSAEGDCLLLTGADRKRMLIDGGMNPSYREHVAETLSGMKKLDLVYVSHIDADHISGILRMVDDLVEWRVHDFESKKGSKKKAKKPPTFPRPPEIAHIWHNAFHEQVGDNAGEIENMLAANAVILSANANSAGVSASKQEISNAVVRVHQNLATSQAQALQLARRVGSKQLNIPVNQLELNKPVKKPVPRKLLLVREKTKTPIKLGGMSIYIIGPFKQDLEDLRKEWNDWLEKNRDRLGDIQRRAKADEDSLVANEISGIKSSMLGESAKVLDFKIDELEAEAKALGLSSVKKLIGRRDRVTTANLASLMLLIEEGTGAKKKTLLLTGDGHAKDILAGLKHYKKLDAAGRMHVDVFKVPHHGAEFNTDQALCDAITADHYVFCGNGAHENPDLDIIEMYFDSRMKPGDKRKFKFWFNSNAGAASKAKDRAHMKKIEKLIPKLEAKSGGRMSSEFLNDHSFEFKI
jgi:beta-lactamase superfamily II metal-dependent hydrolase